MRCEPANATAPDLLVCQEVTRRRGGCDFATTIADDIRHGERARVLREGNRKLDEVGPLRRAAAQRNDKDGGGRDATPVHAPRIAAARAAVSTGEVHGAAAGVSRRGSGLFLLVLLDGKDPRTGGLRRDRRVIARARVAL